MPFGRWYTKGCGGKKSVGVNIRVESKTQCC
jgi:hypothetical protein